MTGLTAIYTGVLGWLRENARPGGADLSVGELVRAEQKGGRPPPPYLSVKVISVDGRIGAVDERLDSLDAGTPQVTIRGQRRATVSVTGYGEDTASWIGAADLALGDDAVRATLRAEGISLYPLGDLVDSSEVVKGSFEARYSRSYVALYRLDSAAREAVALAEVVVDGGDAGSLDDLPFSATIPVP